MASWAVIRLNADMNFQIVPLKPASAALRKVRRLRSFANAENAGIELPRGIFAAGRHGQLNMFNTRYCHRPILSLKRFSEYP